MIDALQNLSPETQQMIVGALVGLVTMGLQHVVTRWPAASWLNPGSSNTTKRLTALFTTALACLTAGKVTSADLIGLLNLFAAGYAANQGLFSLIKATTERDEER